MSNHIAAVVQGDGTQVWTNSAIVWMTFAGKGLSRVDPGRGSLTPQALVALATDAFGEPVDPASTFIRVREAVAGKPGPSRAP